MSPKNGKPGHIFTIYQNSITKLYGTAGISVEDYISPVYNSIDSLVAGLALKSQYDNFHITGVKVTDEIFNNQNAFVDLPKQYVKDMNLTDIFGVMFKTENTQFGKLGKGIYENNYTINLENTVIELKDQVGEIKGPIISAEIIWQPDISSLEIKYNNNHRYLESIEFLYGVREIESIWVGKYDIAKNEKIRTEAYVFNERRNVFQGTNPFTEEYIRDMPQKESQEYIDLANYFLILMKNDETKELWEQTKKQREIDKAKEDSLQINLPKD